MSGNPQNKYQNKGKGFNLLGLCFFEGWWLSDVTKRCCALSRRLNTALFFGMENKSGECTLSPKMGTLKIKKCMLKRS
jgi:hypothetical protein